MSAIVIGVRVRPFNQRELKFNSTNIVGMPTDKPGMVTLKVVRQGKILPDPPREFNFDHAFWTHDGEGGSLPDGSPATNVWADQQMVFEKLGRPVLSNVLEGYNATLFAYGQTGSGKTYTMMGYPPNDVGITPRICDELFSSLAEMAADADEFQLTTECSYLEIYNEEVHDLLAKERSGHGLKVRQHPKTGVFVEGLRKVLVTQANDVLQILSDGNTARTVAATNMNASSSRSHAVVTITVGLTMTRNGVIQGKYAKLVLVDLAGSERASSTGATGSTLVEGSNINKSLTTLGMVLGRLADQAETGKSLPVPFRDSSLTFLLHDSFGGNSKTAMFANISPADVNYDETLSTLRFAAVTKRVKNKAIVNENPAAKLIRELTEELSGLKEKLASLKERRVASALPEAGTTEGAAEGEDTAGDAEATDEEAQLQQLIEDGLAAQGSLVCAPEAAAPEAAEEAPAEVSAEDSAAAKAAAEAAADGVVFVDWHKPHLINLCPESSSLILTVPAGDSFAIVDDATNPASTIALATRSPSAAQPQPALKITFSPLLNSVAIERLADGTAVFINGLAVGMAAPTALEHGDRLAVGALLFRVSHSTNIPTATPYSRLYRCEDHIILAEAYHRQYVTHRWAAALASMVRGIGEGVAAVDIDGSPRRGGLPFPHHHTSEVTADGEAVAALTEEEEVAAANPPSAVVNASHMEDCNELEFAAVTDLRHAENDLVAQFPVSSAELAAYAREYQERVRGTGLAGADAAAAPAPAPLQADASITSDTDRGDDDPMLAPMAMGMRDVTQEQLRQWSSEGQEEYLQARREHEEALDAQQAMIAALKMELEALSKEQHTAEPSAEEAQESGHAGEVTAAVDGADAEQEREAVEQALAEELRWHQEVRLLRNFRQGGPSDEKDAVTWRFYAEEAKGTFPFLSQILTEQERFYESAAQAAASAGPSSAVFLVDAFADLKARRGSVAAVSDSSSALTADAARRTPFTERFGRRGTFYKMQQNKEKWDLRFYLIIDHFLYYFHSCVGTFRCLGALYLKGCSINYIGAHGGQTHVVLVKLAAPRRAEEPRDSSFYFAYATQKDAALWCHWMSVASCPTMPKTMVDRLTKEAVAQFAAGGVSLATDHQFYPVNPLLLGLSDLKVTSGGESALAQWKNDEQVTSCENCEAKFTFFNRRHHCRVCGGIFCGTCAPKFGKDSERTCVPCQGRPSAEAHNSVALTVGRESSSDVLEATVVTVPSADVASLDDSAEQQK